MCTGPRSVLCKLMVGGLVSHHIGRIKDLFFNKNIYKCVVESKIVYKQV